VFYLLWARGHSQLHWLRGKAEGWWLISLRSASESQYPSILSPYPAAGTVLYKVTQSRLWAMYSQLRVPWQITTHQLVSTTEFYFLIAPEAGSLSSRCWQGWFLWRPLSLACVHLVSLCVYLCPNLFSL
jgi:hypothetical protein